MRIEHRIYLSNAVNIALLVLIGAFAMHSFGQIETKFRFTSIADNLNTTFLEMRLAEKNYFLYNDPNALYEIRLKIDRTSNTLSEVHDDIIKAVGASSFNRLKHLLQEYQKLIFLISETKQKNDALRLQLREIGQQLKTFSENTTNVERDQVGRIIGNTTTVLHYAFWTTVLLAFISSTWNGRNIRRSLRRVVDLTRSIAKGNFNYQKIDEQLATNEMGSVITAINTMAEELRRREQEIVQSKRLASIGVLVAGVAHELNNPLNNISMIAQTYAEVYDHLEKEQRIGFMEQIDEQTERLRVTIRNLLDFAKPKEQHLDEKEINDVIQKCLGLVHNMLDVSNIKMHLALAPDLPACYIDEHQVQQVLVNIMVNAIQAMPSGGKLSIVSRLFGDNKMLEIVIQDTGKGIAPEFMDHIFDPFFTTKGDAGTGLGLWVSYGIIKNHQGNMKVTSTVGEGTAFTITLPTSRKSDDLVSRPS
ncbi:MAG: ATP-binding protein [Desulfobulbaceae bacterium]|nr:ATP-binding protein [Desulfobulbaceae bacterium]